VKLVPSTRHSVASAGLSRSATDEIYGLSGPRSRNRDFNVRSLQTNAALRGELEAEQV
jgi:hypothetical protein